MNYYIAYLDDNGKGFGHNNLPFVVDPYTEEYGIEEAYNKADFMNNHGYKRVTIFRTNRILPEEITWEYVEKHKVVEQ